MKPLRKRSPTLDEMARGECSPEELVQFQEVMKTFVGYIQEILKQYEASGLGPLLDKIKEAQLIPEVKNSPIAMKVSNKFIELIEEHSGIPNALDSVFEPITAPAIKAYSTEAHRKAGSASKKKTGKENALTCWDDWRQKPANYKNKTTFCKHLVTEQFCNTDKTAGKWVEEFRLSNPAPLLEKILPQKK
jgi:hypothetical protein